MPLSNEDELVEPDHGQDSGAVVSEERSALLATEQDGVASVATAGPGTSEHEGDWTAPGDPTQQLLSVFGRIEPAMLRGKQGEPQETWAHAIMERLVESIEVAVAADWPDLVTVLTETSRVLKTYQDAGRAIECVPFIEDSYEILCLMAGDLIVDKVRSGVMQKWRDRYEMALAELAAAGLVLVDAEAAVGAGAGVGDPQLELPVERKADLYEETPWPDTGLQSEKETAVAERDEPPVEDSSIESLVDETEEEVEEIPAKTEDAPMAETHETTVEGVGLAVAQHLDTLRETLSEVSIDPENTPRSTYAAVDKCLVLLAQEAGAAGRTEAGEACRVMARMCCSAYRKEAVPNDRFFELAYAFCGVHSEAERTREWIDECTRFLTVWTGEPEEAASQEPVEMAEEPSTEPAPEVAPELEAELQAEPEQEPEQEQEPQEESAEQLLEIAQKAAAEGNVAGAKKLALRAAAQIAQAQIVQAEALVQETEAQLRESAEAIEAATRDVEQAKQEVRDAEERVRESQGEVDARSDAVAQVQSRLEEFQGRLAELEEQLRELQERHDEVEQQRCETDAELAAARDRQAETIEDHEMRVEDEGRARGRVADLQEQEEELHRKRAEIEADMTRARESLERERASAADIEKTIGEVPGTASDAEGGSDDLLF